MPAPTYAAFFFEQCGNALDGGLEDVLDWESAPSLRSLPYVVSLCNGSTQAFKLSMRHITATQVRRTFAGWSLYLRQPVLPASLAYILLGFNAVLSPGGLMTAFLASRGLTGTSAALFRCVLDMRCWILTFSGVLGTARSLPGSTA